MFRFVILSIVAVAASVADTDAESCKRSLHPGIMRCCKKDPASKFMMMDDAQECFKLSRDPVSCARDICIAKKKGFITADDKLDKAKLEEALKTDYEGEPKFVEAIKKSCINGDLEMYGPPDFCELMKMRHCVMMQAIKVCPEWSDENGCKGTKELAGMYENVFVKFAIVGREAVERQAVLENSN